MTRFNAATLAVLAGAASTALAAPPAFQRVQPADSNLTAARAAPVNPNGQLDMVAGASVGDFNNDGYQDVFMPSDSIRTDTLYLNNGDGTFSDASREWGLSDTHVGVHAAVGDYDNDGDLDVYVTSYGDSTLPGATDPHTMEPGKHRLYRNDGGTFTNVAVQAGVNETSANHPDGFGAAFGDIDADGDLDLFVTGRFTFTYNDGDTMFRNNGDGTFTEVTTELFGDFFTADRTYSFSPRFVDMNHDLRPELLLTSDYGESRYFEQLPDGTFVNLAPGNGTAYDSNGMGHTVADINEDGHLDWYVTSIYWDDQDRHGPESTGNMLYINKTQNHLFSSSSEDRNCRDGGWGWGTEAVDFNHDGLVDIAETNGWRNSIEHVNEMARLYMCQPDHAFVDAAAAAGFDHDGDGRALLTFDYDNDADMDILVVGLEEQLHLFRNDVAGDDANSLRLLFDSSAVPGIAPNGFGVSAVAHVNGQSKLRYLDGGCGYLSQSELSLHFGLGDAETVDSLIVTWPNGDVTRLVGVSANQTHTVVAGGGPADFNGDGVINSTDLGKLLSVWGSSNIAADLDEDGAIGSTELGTLLANWD